MRAIIIFSILSPLLSYAQLTPIGQWREHHSWTKAIRVTGNRTTIWCATENSVFYIDLDENSLHPLGKTKGLSSTGIKETSWDEQTGTFLIGYRNSVIDLVKDDKVTPLYSLAAAAPGRSIKINSIFTNNGQAFVATELGVVVIDLVKQEVKETCVIGNNGNKIPVYYITASKDTLYASTAEGIKKASRSGSNLADFRSWKKGDPFAPAYSIDSARIHYWKDLLLIQNRDTLWTWNGNSSAMLFADGWNMEKFSVSEESVLIVSKKENKGKITLLDNSGKVESVIENAYWTSSPSDAYRTGNTCWIADQQRGLTRYTSNNFTAYSPYGPAQINTGQMVYAAASFWIAPFDIITSRTSANRKGQPNRFFEDEWSNASDLPDMNWDSLTDIHCIAYDQKENILWGGSLRGGLFSLRGKNILTLYNSGTPLQPTATAFDQYRIGGVALDKTGQLWMTNDGAANNLHARSREGNWLSFRIPYALQENAAGRLVIDPFGQKWIQLPNAQGMVCFNDGNTPSNSSDDRWRLFRAGRGLGNLPDNEVLCMAVDKNDFLWIGTGKGIGVLQCTETVVSNNGCETVLPVVQQDNFAGYLFKDQRVQCIAVDGANRKWIGTKNGVWLLSSDADSTLYRFDTENSPLPDNDIREIAIHPETGEVFFATPGGMVSFRSTATEASENSTDITIFPNPVPPDYKGWIAMKGLKENTLVKITTTDGRLVFETRALGGQAIWNGRDARGQKVVSGVYLVLSAEGPKNIRSAGKIVFIGK